MRPAASFERRQTFVDTSAYYALLSPRDANRGAATRIAQRLASERWRLVTTNFILAETHALTLARLGRQIAWRAALEIRGDRNTTVIRVTPADERRAWEIVEQYDDKNYSWTDATSFAIMDRLDIVYAFHFDRNFTQHGLTGLQP